MCFVELLLLFVFVCCVVFAFVCVVVSCAFIALLCRSVFVVCGLNVCTMVLLGARAVKTESSNTKQTLKQQHPEKHTNIQTQQHATNNNKHA